MEVKDQKRRPGFLKGLLFVLLFLLALFAIYKLGFFQSPTKDTWKEEAIKRFEETRLTSFSDDARQDFIDAITGKKDWRIAFEEVNYKETGYFEIPLIAVETYLFKNEDGSSKVLLDKLYLFDYNDYEWKPASERKDLVVSEEIVESEKTDIWSGGNNWVKAHFKNGDGNKDKENSSWGKCANMLLFENFDIETDLSENNECYQVQQDLQEIIFK